MDPTHLPVALPQVREELVPAGELRPAAGAGRPHCVYMCDGRVFKRRRALRTQLWLRLWLHRLLLPKRWCGAESIKAGLPVGETVTVMTPLFFYPY